MSVPPAAARPPDDLVPALVRMADALAWPLMLVDDQGPLHHANHSARALLAAGRPLRLGPQRRLQPAAASYQGDFWLALQAAAVGQVCELHWPGSPGSPGSPGDRAATLRSLAQLPGGSALLLLDLPPDFNRARWPRPDVAGYAQAHGLSAAQQLLLQALAQGCSVAQVAAEQGLPPSTVRSRLVALRRKTGHARVDELLRTLWALPPALGAAVDGK